MSSQIEDCSHVESGWCIECVTRLVNAINEYLDNDGSRRRFDPARKRRAYRKLSAALALGEIDDDQDDPDRFDPIVIMASALEDRDRNELAQRGIELEGLNKVIVAPESDVEKVRKGETVYYVPKDYYALGVLLDGTRRNEWSVIRFRGKRSAIGVAYNV